MTSPTYSESELRKAADELADAVRVYCEPPRFIIGAEDHADLMIPIQAMNDLRKALSTYRALTEEKGR